MRAGQVRPAPDDGSPKFSKRELMTAAGVSAKTFDTIRKAARVKGPVHGGLGWEFSVEDVVALTRRAGSGRFSERGWTAAEAWREMLAEVGVRVEE